ncbi:TPA: ATP-binding cassette domain-containing protein [Clostridium botulinum]|uniref:ATP-binding cassette domain-containing protein n=1 Tax=Clostridium TaxID=1485 RepID=UPI000773F5A4|nr:MULTISPECIES: ATP-binding cassette domain-containing protein [Clostridium]AUM94330.1 hypothetical protein RSJ11_03845 [Clostridium sporogenes]AVQ51758.1 hypothetical protein C7M59_02360 [Clostridium botulinum]HBJ2615203.1 ATP-binding cassette domain-containing protein [Clostridium botulinum]
MNAGDACAIVGLNGSGKTTMIKLLARLYEPTASIDAQADYLLFGNFKQLTKNRTSVLISHIFSTVKVDDIIVVLKDGKIIENGTHVQLMMKNGFYSNLYNMQVEAYMDDTYGKKVNVN